MITVGNTIPIYSESDLQKAIKAAESQNMTGARNTVMEAAQKIDTKSMIIDPNNILNYVGTRAKPNTVGAAILRSMAIRCKPVAAILKTRMNQFSKHTRRPRHDHDTGFFIGTKDRKRRLTPAEQKEAFRLEEALLTGGMVKNAMRKDNFDMFTRKVLRDSLVLDAMCWENVFTRGGTWAEMWAIDASTIELVVDQRFGADFPVYIPETQKALGDIGNISYVQKINGQIYAEYTEEELAYGIRNPRTDLHYTLFGLSELEELIETVTYILNAEKYNGAYFSESHLPMGVLSVVGQYDDETMEAFKRNWENLTSGVVGKWKVPVIASSDGSGVNFIPFKQSSKDMEYHQWMTFLTTIACAIYQIAPEEIGFEGYSAQGKSSLSGDDTDAKVAHSKDKGLEPLALFYENILNAEIIDRMNPEFALQFRGISEEDDEEKWALIEKKLTMGYTTVALERKANDDDPILDPETGKEAAWTHAPANTVLAQFAQSQQQAQQQQDQANQAHEQGLEQLAAQHAMGLHQQEQQMGQQDDLAENQHGREMEKMGLQGAQQQAQQQQQLKGQKDLQAMKDTGAAIGERGKMSHEITKQNLQHSQSLEQQREGHGQKLEQQQAGHQQTLEQQREGHGQKLEQQHEAGKQQQTHDLRKMGLQHGLDEKSARNDHERELIKRELEQAYAYLNKEDDRAYAEEHGGDEGVGNSQTKARKSKSTPLKKGLETEAFRGSDDDILIVIRLTD